jgi:hypothetical protein
MVMVDSGWRSERAKTASAEPALSSPSVPPLSRLRPHFGPNSPSRVSPDGKRTARARTAVRKVGHLTHSASMSEGQSKVTCSPCTIVPRRVLKYTTIVANNEKRHSISVWSYPRAYKPMLTLIQVSIFEDAMLAKRARRYLPKVSSYNIRTRYHIEHNS